MVTKVMELKMTESEINQYAKDFLRKAYNMELTIPITINGRLHRSMGKFTYIPSERRSLSIQIAKKLLKHADLEVIKTVIKHELIHYALYEKGLPYMDGDEYFENELKKHGSISTGILNLNLERNVNVYECIRSSCKKEYRTIRALTDNGKYHVCNKCGADIEYLGKRKMRV